MKLGKGPKSPIIPVGDFEKVQAADEEQSFYEAPSSVRTSASATIQLNRRQHEQGCGGTAGRPDNGWRKG
jgi:hypothetical protein